MRLVAYYSKKDIDRAIAEAFVAGAAVYGVDALARPKSTDDRFDSDVVMLFGVKAMDKFRAFREAGAQTIILDKGYSRKLLSYNGLGRKYCEYWRVAVNAHHPTRYLSTMQSPPDRFERLGLAIAPWRESGEAIIYAGSSAKYHRFNGLPEPTAYATGVVRQLRKRTKREIIYRPKLSWMDAVPVPGATFSRQPHHIEDLLPGAHALVTNGSNACFEAVLAGIPTIVLGEAVARPISSTEIDDIEVPRLASMDERRQWAADMSYCQWTLEEFRSGEAWSHIARHLS